MGTIWKVLTRKKVIDPVTSEETQLARRLNTFDLTALGVGSTLGVGVYVLAGQVATTAGPSVVLSFLIAAVASVFAGLCYAEFGARAPRAGSAYIYSYVCVGEFIAFVIGWNLILEYVIGSASVAKGLSLYLDNLINNTLQTTFTEIAPIDLPYMAKYFDFFSCGISILLAIALAFGMKESSLANTIFTTLNIGVVLFVVIAGSLKADTANWNYKPDSTANATVVGKGGFFPFGLEGTITGAATCFYGFVGFDCIATTGEEVKDPKKAIPISIVLSLLIIFLAYFGISTVVTLMVPYYLQDFNAPIPYAFEHIGWNWAKWVVSIGGIFGLCASLFGAMFPLPRIIYAMANDGLVFKFLGRVSSKFQTPVIGTLLAGTLTGLMAALFELGQLVKMMSIGTLMAYTIVAASVLLLRYSDNIATFTINNDSANANEDIELLSYEQSGGSSAFGQIFNCGRHSEPTKMSQFIVSVEVFLYCVVCVLIGFSAIFLKHPISNGETWAIVLASCFIFVAAILIMSIATQPVSRRELSFKVPMVPLIPALSILVNIYLMMMLDFHTWIRFAVWMALGIPTYYFSLRPIDEQPTKPVPIHEPSENHCIEKSNGLASYTNDGFIDDYGKTAEMKRKKKAPQPPISDEKSEDIKIQQELEKFDEMLDEVVRNSRKISAGTISVCDVIREVADVHIGNVITPANPISPNDSPTIIVDIKTENVISNQLETKTPPTEDDSTVSTLFGVEQNTENVETKRNGSIGDGQVVTPPSGVDINPSKLFLKRMGSGGFSGPIARPISFISYSGSDQDLVEASPFHLTPTPTPPPSINVSPISSPNIDNDVPYVTPPPPPPPPLPEDILDTQNIHSEKKINTRETLPRVTSNKIKEVTLRPTRKKEATKEVVQFEPDDDNLKIGTDKTKSFMENLNKKLKQMNVVANVLPTYIAPIKKGTAPPPPKQEKNENVIEESINKNEAKEKLGLFVNSRISIIDPTKISESEKPKSYLEESNIDNSSELNNDDTPELNNNNILENNNSADNDNEENAYLVHQNRMKNVFRSMKSLDLPKKQPSSAVRNVKTMDHRPDETKHKQAMSEIFKSIQVRRKESADQHSKI